MTERGYMPQAKSREWGTPQDLFDSLENEFNFTLDPCATAENTKCKKFYTMETDGLKQSWTGERVFMNPPYGNALNLWVRKAFEEIYGIAGADLVVALLPVRSDTKWFHNYVYGYAEIRFLKGRVRYTSENGKVGNSSTFPSMIVIWRRVEL